MENVLDVLRARGYIKQTVYEDELYELLGKESVTFYTGYDPTADSLHVGHFVTLMAMAHMQRAASKSKCRASSTCPTAKQSSSTTAIGF